MIEYTIDIELNPGSNGSVRLFIRSEPQERISFNQGNVGIISFIFKIWDGGNEIDYSLFSDARITLSHREKAILNSPCVIEPDCIRYLVEPEALGRTGTIKGQLDLSDGDKNLATTYFSFEVFRSLTALAEADKRVFVNEIEELLKEIEAAAAKAASVIGEAANYLTELSGISERISGLAAGAESDAGAIEGFYASLSEKTAQINALLSSAEQAKDNITNLHTTAQTTVNTIRNLLSGAEVNAGEISGLLDESKGLLASVRTAKQEAENLLNGIAGINTEINTLLASSKVSAESITGLLNDFDGKSDELTSLLAAAGVSARAIENLETASQAAAQRIEDLLNDTESGLFIGPAGKDGVNGWSPVTSVEADGIRRVLRVTGWTGGTGTMPATGKYIGASGLVDNIALASDIRGGQGLQGERGEKGETTFGFFTVRVDEKGDLYVTVAGTGSNPLRLEENGDLYFVVN